MSGLPATARRALDAYGGEALSHRVVTPRKKDGTPSRWPVLIDLFVREWAVEPGPSS